MPRKSKQALLSELDANALRCRTISHSWEEVPVTFIRQRQAIGGIRMMFRCVRCQTLRSEAWTVHGKLIMRTYIHPKNWVKVGRMPKDNLRQFYLTQRDGPVTTQQKNRTSRSRSRKGA